MKKVQLIILGTFLGSILSSCDSFLNEKPVKSILIPSTIEDVRVLLDNYTTLNVNPLSSFILADDWVTSPGNWQGLSPWEQNAYQWQSTLFQPQERSVDYSRIHRKIFFANNCLEILEKLEDTSVLTQQLKGEALFVRSMALYHLAQLFFPHPSSENANQIKVPIRFKAEVSSKTPLLGIADLIEKIEQDLIEAQSLLPIHAEFPNRPDQKSVAALLSGFYLYLGDYDQALKHAQNVLSEEVSLLDYGVIDNTLSYPFQLFNQETLYYGVTSSFTVTASSATWINPELTKLYDDNDFRKSLFFNIDQEGNFLFRGSYLGDFNLFTGIGLSEVVLNAMESAWRMGNKDTANNYFKVLINHRYQNPELRMQQIGELNLELILEERRKELVFRGTRWSDMKRLAAKGELNSIPMRQLESGEFLLEEPHKFYIELPELEQDLENG